LVDVGKRQPCRFPRGRIDFGKKGNQPTVAELGMGMSELELAPLRIAVSLPALLALRQRQDIRPSDRFLAPTQRVGHGLPHGDDYRGKDKVVRSSDQVLASLTL